MSTTCLASILSPSSSPAVGKVWGCGAPARVWPSPRRRLRKSQARKPTARLYAPRPMCALVADTVLEALGGMLTSSSGRDAASTGATPARCFHCDGARLALQFPPCPLLGHCGHICQPSFHPMSHFKDKIDFAQRGQGSCLRSYS